MAASPYVHSQTERERIAPYVEELKALVRRFDPDARFSLSVGHVPEFWELSARVRPDVDDDDEVRQAIAEKQTDILVDHDAAIAVILLPRD